MDQKRTKRQNQHQKKGDQFAPCSISQVWISFTGRDEFFRIKTPRCVFSIQLEESIQKRLLFTIFSYYMLSNDTMM